MAQFCFIRANRYEYIYLGSPRIHHVWRHLVEKKHVDGFVDFDFIKEVQDRDDCILIEPIPEPGRILRKKRPERAPLRPTKDRGKDHQCSSECLQEDGVQIEKYSLFHRPLAVGFKRIQGESGGQPWTWKKPFYLSPCNRKLTNINAIQNYLSTTGSSLRIDSFSLDQNFEPSENVQLPYSNVVIVAVSDKAGQSISKYIVAMR